jgi:hypothetical protein
MKKIFISGVRRNSSVSFTPSPTECRELGLNPKDLLILNVRDRNSGEYQIIRQKAEATATVTASA